MATKLKNLNVKKVDFVDEGANQQADIKLFKRRDGEGEPSTQKEPALKRFIAAFAKMAGLYDEAMGEISQNSDVTVEKGNSQTFGEKMTEVKRQ